MMIDRDLELQPSKNYLLFGPRRVGKSTFLKQHYPDAEWIDLLKTDLFYEYSARPALIRERFATQRKLIIIDEVQRLPDLLHEVHWLLENSENRFILSGSSARKLRRQGVTNLAGRLSSAHLFPLTHHEMPQIDLLRRLQYGHLPPIVLSPDPAQDLKDYCGEYLREEIQAEGQVRSLPTFIRFLEVAALSNAQLVSFTNIARECGISVNTAKEYFQILEDTLLGHWLLPWTRSQKRRARMHPKFYFFDCGLPNTLLGRTLSPKTPEFGQSFEQWMILETLAAQSYHRRMEQVRFWRSVSGHEVDLLIDEHTAVEFKIGRVSMADAKGLLALAEEITLQNKWIVGIESHPRTLEKGVQVLPWTEFLQRLQAGSFKE